VLSWIMFVVRSVSVAIVSSTAVFPHSGAYETYYNRDGPFIPRPWKY